jgi:hypothetical protein
LDPQRIEKVQLTTSKETHMNANAEKRDILKEADFGVATNSPITAGQPLPNVPQQILYLILNYRDANGNMVFDPITGMLLTTYGAGSGIYPNTMGITNFADSIRNGTIVLNPQTPIGPNDHPQITDLSYVVFSIDKFDVAEFRRRLDATSTDDSHAGEYFNLVHYQDDGASFDGNNLHPLPAPTSPAKCHIVYFVANSPSTAGQSDPPVADQFSLYVLIPKVPGPGTVPKTIDPDIKNTGHKFINTGPKKAKTG